MIPLLPQDGVDPVDGKLDVCFLCVMELVALLVIHLLKCFLLDRSPNKSLIPYPLVSPLLHASELQQGILVSRETPCTWQLCCSPHVVSQVSAPGLGEAGEAFPGAGQAAAAHLRGCLAASTTAVTAALLPLPSSFGDKAEGGRAWLLTLTRRYSCSLM